MLSQPLRNLQTTAQVTLAAPRTSVADAAGLMLARGVAADLVVDQGALLGIFTEHDIATRVVALGRDPQAVEIGAVMTREPLTVDPDSTLGHALVLMHENAIRHLPVVETASPSASSAHVTRLIPRSRISSASSAGATRSASAPAARALQTRAMRPSRISGA